MIRYVLAAALIAAAAPAGAKCTPVAGQAADLAGRRTFLYGAADFAADQVDRAAVIAAADAALAHPLASVLDKTTIPPSDDRHDYISLAPYWWPDPANPKGPWVRRDGEVNPVRGTARFDRNALGRMVGDVDALARAYAVTGDRRYAERATQAIRKWFLDPATAMNPNLNFAQMVPGVSNGRAEGVLDGSGFQRVVDAIGLIGPAGTLSAGDQAGLKTWFGRYVDWLLKAPNAREERDAKNNHGIWYDSQLLHLALFAGREEVARQVVRDFPKRLAGQVEADGRMPRELARTRSFHYSLYALEPAYNVAALAACVGADFWDPAKGVGKDLQRATDFLAPYRGRAQAWPYRELEWPADELDRLLKRANQVWPGRYSLATTP